MKERTTLNKRLVLDYWKEACLTPEAMLKEQTIFNIQDSTYTECFCWACGIRKSNIKGLEACHIVPHCLGGSDSFENIFLMCADCHFESPDHKNKQHFFKWLKQKDSNFSIIAKKVYSLVEDVDFLSAALSLDGKVKDICNDEFNNIGTHSGRVKLSTTLASVDEIRNRVIEKAEKLMRTDYLGRPIPEMTVPDKDVLCYRCLRMYNLAKAPRSAPDKLYIREPKCPNCNCKIYFSGG